MPFALRHLFAKLLALPAFMVPSIEIPLMLWTRAKFIELNPEYVENPPTISRAISDPVVGAPFANWILVITALIAVVVIVLIWAYALAIFRLAIGPWRRLVLYMMLFFTMLFQILASLGMVITTQITLSVDHDLHMMGSYLFFCCQALAILLAGILCWLLAGDRLRNGISDLEWYFRPHMHRFRFRFALAIMGLVVLYGVLFVVKDHELPISDYAVQVAYTQCEVVVISSFVLFLGTYSVDIHHMFESERFRESRKTRN